MAAISVGRQTAVDAECTIFNKRARFAPLAETQAFETEKHRWGEVVVAHQRVYVVLRNARHLICVCACLAHLVVPELLIEIADSASFECVACAYAGNQHRRFVEVGGSLAGCEDHANGAVIDETIVEQPERLDYPARCGVVVEGD